MHNKKSGEKTCLRRFIQHPHWKLTRAVANEFSEKRKPWDAQLNFATGLLLCYLKEKNNQEKLYSFMYRQHISYSGYFFIITNKHKVQ